MTSTIRPSPFQPTGSATDMDVPEGQYALKMLMNAKAIGSFSLFYEKDGVKRAFLGRFHEFRAILQFVGPVFSPATMGFDECKLILARARRDGSEPIRHLAEAGQKQQHCRQAAGPQCKRVV